MWKKLLMDSFCRRECRTACNITVKRVFVSAAIPNDFPVIVLQHLFPSPREPGFHSSYGLHAESPRIPSASEITTVWRYRNSIIIFCLPAQSRGVKTKQTVKTIIIYYYHYYWNLQDSRCSRARACNCPVWRRLASLVHGLKTRLRTLVQIGCTCLWICDSLTTYIWLWCS